MSSDALFTELSSAFQDLDIAGDGLLDQGLFLTAMGMLGVTLPPSEVDKIFQVLDEDGTGNISYTKLEHFIKIGKIPSDLLSACSSPRMPDVQFQKKKKRKSVVLNEATSMQLQQQQQSAQLYNGYTTHIQKKVQAPPPMDLNRLKIIQRAVVVIKEAVTKKISKDEVSQFLQSKGMSVDDIELAHEKAHEQAMTPEQRIKHLGDLAQTRLNQCNEQQRMNEYFSEQLAAQTREIQVLRQVLQKSSDALLVKCSQLTAKEMISKAAANELKQKIMATTAEMKQAQQNNNEQIATIYRHNLEVLQTISQCVLKQQHFHAFLYMYQLEPSIRESMPQLLAFVDEYHTLDGVLEK